MTVTLATFRIQELQAQTNHHHIFAYHLVQGHPPNTHTKPITWLALLMYSPCHPPFPPTNAWKEVPPIYKWINWLHSNLLNPTIWRLTNVCGWIVLLWYCTCGFRANICHIVSCLGSKSHIGGPKEGGGLTLTIYPSVNLMRSTRWWKV